MGAREAALQGQEPLEVGGGLDDRIAEFARFLEREERSPETIRSYAWALRDLRDYLLSRGVGTLEAISRAHLEAWQDRLKAAHMRPRSRSLAATSVRQFLRWAADHDYCDPRLKDWLASVRLRPLKPKPIPAIDLAKLLAYFAPSSIELKTLRNRAMFMVYLSTGLRVSEGLRLPRTGWERGQVRQKGGSEKLVTVPDYVQPIVREYLAARVDASPLLFVTHPGGRPMTASAVRGIWHEVARKVGSAPFTTHQLRHTFATQMLAQGVDVRVVAELMGHKNMASIMIYTEVQEEARQDAFDAFRSVINPAEQPFPKDPRTLSKPTLGRVKRRGRPRFRIVPPPGNVGR